MKFAEKIKMMCVRTGLSPTDFVASAGFSHGAYSYWNQTGNTPDAEGIAKIANAFHVSVEELMEDVETKKGRASCVKKLQTFATGDAYTEQEEEIIKTYRKLSARQQAKFLNFIFELEEQTP